MSQEVFEMDNSVDNSESDVQLVYNETEFVLDPSELQNGEFNDVICSDGTRAILVNGHLLQSGAQTIVLQDAEDLSQYYINDETESVLVTNEQDLSNCNSLEGAEIIEYVKNNENFAEETQVVYVSNEDEFAMDQQLSDNFQIESMADESVELPVESVKLETQILDLDDFVQQSGGTLLQNDQGSPFQYAILRDGKLHIQAVETDELLTMAVEKNNESFDGNNATFTQSQLLDLSKITGKNLLTGQTVTLHSYMNKLQKKINNNLKSSSSSKKQIVDSSPMNYNVNKISQSSGKNNFNNLLNKKIKIGKTTTGKTLVGRIVNIKKKDGHLPETDAERIDSEECALQAQIISGNNPVVPESETEEPHLINSEETYAANYEPQSYVKRGQEHVPQEKVKKICVKAQVISKECFDSISRTIGGLMNMETIKKKLQYKNIIVKVVEKKYSISSNSFNKNVSYCYGYLEEQYIANQKEELVESWVFVQDKENQELIFRNGVNPEDIKHCDTQTKGKFFETINLTLMITEEKTGERTTRVIFNPTNGFKCWICAREFRSDIQLRLHKNNTHNYDGSQTSCEICAEKQKDFSALQEHRKVHIDEGSLFQCEECNKTFLSPAKLNRHLAVHNITMRPLQCSVCFRRCSNESVLKKHLMTHMNIKPFSCETCGKAFTNQGDLNFHQRIHDPHKHFSCPVCGRTFSRHSNLQRHVEIHKGAGALYKCDICGCAYHYISSLTRHVVQNHVNVSWKNSTGEDAMNTESSS